MDRYSLLNGLYVVRDMMGKVFNASNELDSICESYEESQEGISTRGLVDKGRILMWGFIIVYGLIGLARHNVIQVGSVVAFFVFQLGNIENFWTKILYGVLALESVGIVFSCLQSPATFVAYGFLFGIAALICGIIIKTKNSKVEKFNQWAEERNMELHQEYDYVYTYYRQYQDELNQYIYGWFPQHYLTMDCIDFFIENMENMRADNIKELANLYEQEMYNRKMMAMQQQMVDQNQQIITQLRFQNVMHIIEIGQHAQTNHLLQQQNAEISANTSARRMQADAEFESARATDRLTNELQRRRASFF